MILHIAVTKCIINSKVIHLDTLNLVVYLERLQTCFASVEWEMVNGHCMLMYKHIDVVFVLLYILHWLQILLFL